MIMKRAAIQLLSSQGYKSAANDTLKVLVHETVSYIENLYESARQYADLAGNSTPSAFDVLAALEEQGVTAGALNPKYPPGHESLTLADGESVPRRRAKSEKRKCLVNLWFLTRATSQIPNQFSRQMKSLMSLRPSEVHRSRIIYLPFPQSTHTCVLHHHLLSVRPSHCRSRRSCKTRHKCAMR